MTHRDHKFNYELWAEFANLGLLGALVPEEYGGTDSGLVALTLAFEEVCARGFSPSLMLVTCMDTACILRNGSDEMKRRIIPGVVEGKTILVFAVTEPNAGSNTFRIETVAKREGDRYVMNGQKRFTTSAHYADYMWLAGRTDPNVPKHRGISLFLVDMTLPGITHRPLWCMGGEQTNEVYYDNVRVPAEFRVGEENRGWYIISESLDYERSYQMPPGPIRRQFDELLGWARTGDREGRPARERLCSSRSGPKSLATYSSGSWSPSRSAAPSASVQPVATSSAKAPGSSTKVTRGALPARRSSRLRPPFSARDIESCIDSTPAPFASRMRAPSGK